LKGTLSARLILWVGLPAMLVFAAVITSASLRSYRRLSEETQARAQVTARHHAAELEAILRHVEKIPEMIGLEMETEALATPADVETYLRRVVEANPEIYGSAIAFKPFGFKTDTRDYGPYWYRNGGKFEFVQLGTPEYNYPQWPWYRVPRDQGHAIWTEPFFDDGGGNVVMITRAVPFRRKDQFWGIATIDMPVSKLAATVKQIAMGQSGYGFLVSREGRFITHPNPAMIMHRTVQEVNPELAANMANGQDGWMLTREPDQGREAWVAFSPILDGALSLAVAFPRKEVMADANRLVMELVSIGLVGLLLLFGGIVVVARSVARPIGQLAKAAQEVAAGNLELHLESPGATSEVRHLTEAFSKMMRDLQMRMQELRYTTTVKERLEGEMSAARSIQMSLLPKKFPAFPDRTEFDVHAVVRPAREVGGDFYDFFLVDERRLCVLIGDVAGKGVPAALFMAVSKALIKANVLSGVPLSVALGYVNDELCEEADIGMFVTLVIAFLDTATGSLEYANAGHLSPFLLGADHVVTPLDGGHGPALALTTKLKFTPVRHQLKPGDSIFMFTDGVTEALNSTRDFYTPQRLQFVLRDVCELPVQRITRSVIQDVRAFASDQPQADDISVLALRWIGPTALLDDIIETVQAPEPLVRSLT
jgi:sigma-B regulation protein RsbU (phosphoserine phosphatase)